jgi:hypothetical protein
MAPKTNYMSLAPASNGQIKNKTKKLERSTLINARGYRLSSNRRDLRYDKEMAFGGISREVRSMVSFMPFYLLLA